MAHITSCNNCEDRKQGCHDTCEKYQQQKREYISKKKWLSRQNVNVYRRNYYTNLIYGDADLRRKMKEAYH